jgi:hypothetical protein
MSATKVIRFDDVLSWTRTAFHLKDEAFDTEDRTQSQNTSVPHTPCPHLHKFKCRLYFTEAIQVQELCDRSVKVHLGELTHCQAQLSCVDTHPLWSIHVPKSCILTAFGPYTDKTIGATVCCVVSEEERLRILTTTASQKHQIPNAIRLQPSQVGSVVSKNTIPVHHHGLNDIYARIHYMQVKCEEMSFRIQWNLMVSGYQAWAFLFLDCNEADDQSFQWDAVVVPRDESVIHVLRHTASLVCTGCHIERCS